jgi:hypothetical protein
MAVRDVLMSMSNEIEARNWFAVACLHMCQLGEHDVLDVNTYSDLPTRNLRDL